MHEVSWEHSLAFIAMLASISIMLASISIGTASAATEDLETDLDNPEDAKLPQENQQASLAKPERQLTASPPQQKAWSFNWPGWWPFGGTKKQGGSH